jgi:hypothetical protein
MGGRILKSREDVKAEPQEPWIVRQEDLDSNANKHLQVELPCTIRTCPPLGE